MDPHTTLLCDLRADATPDEIHKLTTEVLQHEHAGIVVAPVYISRVVTMVRGAGPRVMAAVSYPSGISKPTIKAIEATSSLKDGADALLVVPHRPHVIRNDFASQRAELLEIVRAARATRREAQIHVLIDNQAMALDEAKLATACRAIRESGGDGIVVTRDALASKRHADSLVVTGIVPANTAADAQGADQLILSRNAQSS